MTPQEIIDDFIKNIVPNITSYPAFSSLLNLISFLGDFLTTPIWFGLSFIQLLLLSFVIHYIIGILLGGISPRTRLEKVNTTNNNIYADFKVLSVSTDDIRTISPHGPFLNKG